MPYIRKNMFDELTRAGSMMSNVCYNLSQRKDQHASETLKESQERWDLAIRAVRMTLPQKGGKK